MNTRLICCLFLCFASMYGAVQFTYSVVEPQQDWNGHKPKVIGDFDNSGQGGIGIYSAGQGFKLYRSPAFVPFLITTYQNGPDDEDARVADVNHDGAPDIIIGGYSGSYWLENPLRQGKDPYASPWAVHVVDRNHPGHDVVTGDVNKDGRIDFSTESGVYLQGVTPDQWPLIGVGQIRRGFQGTSLMDVTGDGYPDVIAPDLTGSRLSWFENPLHRGGDPVTQVWTEHVIDASPGFVGPMTTAVAAFRGLSRADLAMTPMYNDGNLVWYENPADPRQQAWIKHVIGAAHYVHQGSLQAADFDGNGTVDIAFAEQEQSAAKRIGVFFNGGAGGSWQLQVLANTGGHNMKAGLIGSDRYPSLLSANHGFFGASTIVQLWRNGGPAPPVPGTGPVSDEFNGGVLNTALWKFEDPLGDATVKTDGSHVLISVPANIAHEPWVRDYGARIVQPASNKDFDIEVKFDSIPRLRYQMQGIIVEQDNSDYLRFELFHDGASLHLFAATFVSDQPTVQTYLPVAASGTSIWLRLRRSGASWTPGWSTDGANFTFANAFIHTMTAATIGPYAGNAGNPQPAPAATSVVDYFRVLGP